MLPIKPINPYYPPRYHRTFTFFISSLVYVDKWSTHASDMYSQKYTYNSLKIMNELKQAWFYSSFVQSHLFDFSFFLSWTSSYYACPGLCPQNRLFLPLSCLASCLAPLPSIIQMVTRWSFQSIKKSRLSTVKAPSYLWKHAQSCHTKSLITDFCCHSPPPLSPSTHPSFMPARHSYLWIFWKASCCWTSPASLRLFLQGRE